MGRKTESLEDASEDETKAHSKRNPTDKDASRRPPIVRAIIEIPEGVIQEYRANQQRDNASNARNYALSKWAVVGAWLYAAITAFQLYSMRQSNEALVSIQRAFVSFGNIQVSPVLDKPAGKVVEYEFRRQVINDGATPAKDVNAFRDWGAMMSRFTSGFRYTEGQQTTPRTGPALGPKESVDLTPLRIPIGELLNVRDHREEIRFWGTVRYRDIFRHATEHVTEFCVEVLVTGKIDSLDPRQRGLSFPPCDDHNCTDEECNQQDH